jgi:hypothetical protein
LKRRACVGPVPRRQKKLTKKSSYLTRTDQTGGSNPGVSVPFFEKEIKIIALASLSSRAFARKWGGDHEPGAAAIRRDVRPLQPCSSRVRARSCPLRRLQRRYVPPTRIPCLVSRISTKSGRLSCCMLGTHSFIEFSCMKHDNLHVCAGKSENRPHWHFGTRYRSASVLGERPGFRAGKKYLPLSFGMCNHVCMNLSSRLVLSISMHIRMHMHIRMRIRICMRICMHMCMRIHIRMRIRIRIRIRMPHV